MSFDQSATQYRSAVRPSFRIALVLLLSAVIVLSGMSFTNLPYGRAIWDFLFVLDGAYRISLGQLPHVDFASPIGPMTLYLTRASEVLSPKTNSFAGLHALNWLAVVPPLLLLTSRFRSVASLLAALALLALIMLVPITVDQTVLSEISYFASYNRFASGYLFLLGLWLVFPKSRHDWIFLAYILIVLFFLKITACAVAIGLVATATVFNLAAAKQMIESIAFFLVVLCAVELSSAGFVTAYLIDVYDMSRVNADSGLHNLFYAAYKSWVTILLAAVLLCYLATSVQVKGRAGPSAYRRAVELFRQDEDFLFKAALLFVAALLAESQNSGGLGLISIAALAFHRHAWSGTAAKVFLVTLVLASVVLPVATTAFNRMLTVVVRETRSTVPHPVGELFPGTTVTAQTVTAANLFRRINREWPDFIRDLEADGYQLEMDPSSNAPGGMLAWIESAVDAARVFRNGNLGEKSQHYATIAFADPFARMLNLTPAFTTNIVMDIGRTIAVMKEQDAETYLKGSDGVFFSRCERRTRINNDAAFEAVFERSFEKLPLNECWEFYRRIEPS